MTYRIVKLTENSYGIQRKKPGLWRRLIPFVSVWRNLYSDELPVTGRFGRAYSTMKDAERALRTLIELDKLLKDMK